MLKNIEFYVFKTGGIYEPVDFNWDFAAIAYYYLVKLKKVKLPKVNFIKIKIYDDDKEHSFESHHNGNMFSVYTNNSFYNYLSLSNLEKVKYQNKLLTKILIKIFESVGVIAQYILDVSTELESNNFDMTIDFYRIKVSKSKRFYLKIKLQLYCYEVYGEIEQNEEKKILKIFTLKPEYLLFEMFFRKYKVEESSIIFGNIQYPVFKVDIDTELTTIFPERKKLVEESFCHEIR